MLVGIKPSLSQEKATRSYVSASLSRTYGYECRLCGSIMEEETRKNDRGRDGGSKGKPPQCNLQL